MVGETEGHNTIYLIRLCAGSSQIYYCPQVWLEEKDGRRDPAAAATVAPSRGRRGGRRRAPGDRRGLPRPLAVPYLVKKIAVRRKRQFSARHCSSPHLASAIIAIGADRAAARGAPPTGRRLPAPPRNGLAAAPFSNGLSGSLETRSLETPPTEIIYLICPAF